MTLAYPAYLGLLALVPLVVYLHMRRHRPLRVPATALWSLVMEQTDPQPRLRPVRSSLALWLQVATVVVASVALAEPRLGPAGGQHHVLIIEAGVLAGAVTSADGETAYSSGWKRWLATRPRGDGQVYSVWRVADRTQAVALELDSIAAVRRALERTSHIDAPPDWRAAAGTLEKYLSGNELVTVVASDIATAAEALGGVLHAVEPAYLQLATPALNVGLVSVAVEADAGRPERWRIAAEAAVTGDPDLAPQAVTFHVRFTPEGGSASLPYGEAEVRLNLARRARYQADLDLPGPGLLEVGVRTDDALAADDTARLVLRAHPPRPSAVVVTSLGEASPTARVLRAMDRFDVTVVEGALGSLRPDLVVVENSFDPFEQLSWRPQSVVWLGWSAQGAPPTGTGAAPNQVVAWDASHPLAKGTAWGLMGAYSAHWLPPEEGQVIVQGEAGPLVAVRSSHNSRELVVGFDPADASFVASDEFVSLMVDAVDWLVPRRSRVEACSVGEPCVLPWTDVAGGFTALEPSGGRWSSFWSTQAAAVPPRADEAWVPDRAGAWTITTSNGGSFVVAVNPPFARVASSLEDRLMGLPEDPMDTGWQGLPWRGVTSALVLVALALVVFEGLIAGRGTEGFWRAASLRAPGDAGRRQRLTAGLHVLTLAVALAALVSAPLPLPRLAGTVALISSEGQVELPPSLVDQNERRLVRVAATDASRAVDLQQAVERAIASTDPAAPLDLLFATPLAATRGNLLSATPALLDRRVTVSTVPAAPPRPEVDAAASALFFSSERFVGDAARLVGVVHSSVSADGVIRFHLDGEVVSESAVELTAGWNTITATVDLDAAGERLIELVVQVSGDELHENDRLTRVLHVREGPLVRLFARDLERAQALADALELHGYVTVVQQPHTMSIDPMGFAGVDAIVLMDVPAIDLTRTQQEALERWVRERGGGLVLLGGENSFGPGGYLETPLDTLSPLSSKISRDAPAVAMVFVLDRSGSMQQLVDGVTRLDIAKEATLAATDLLGRGSEIAVVVFDEQARTLLPFTDSADTETIAGALRSLVPGGGTAVYPGLVEAAEHLAGSDAASKHVVVMTDGLSQPGDVEAAVARLVELDATVSAIAIGVGSDVERVRTIARLGGGTAHTTTDFRALPSILAQEAMLLSGDPVIREPVTPARTGVDAGLMEALPDVFPPLTGLVETTPKADATVLLQAGEDRPVLAAWRYGAGRVLAYASQAVGPWSNAWSQSPDFADWWSQWLRWVVQARHETGLRLSTEHAGDDLRVDVLATSASGELITGLTLFAVAVPSSEAGDPRGGAQGAVVAPLRETTPGRYTGLLPIGTGHWSVRAYSPDDEALASEEVLVVHDYPASLAAPAHEEPGIEGLLSVTGGRRLDGMSTWRPTRQVTWAVEPGWRPWLLAAMAVWTLFLLVRYAAGWVRLPGLRSRPAASKSVSPTRAAVLRVR